MNVNFFDRALKVKSLWVYKRNLFLFRTIQNHAPHYHRI